MIITSLAACEITGKGLKSPDLRIEGKIFDVYSPKTSSARSILDKVNEKVESQQAARIAIKLGDSNVSYSELKRQFKVGDGGLRPDVLEVIVIDKHGKLRQLYP